MQLTATDETDVPEPEIVLFSPMPPAKNGIGDYAFELLAEHLKRYAVTVVISSDAPWPQAAEQLGARIIRLHSYLRDRGRYSGLRHVFHVGNNPDHVYLLPVLLDTPGLVVIHDVGLNYLVELATLKRGDSIAYVDAMARDHGRAGRCLAEQVVERHWKGSLLPQLLKCNRTITSSAQQVVVHSQYAADQLTGAGLGTPVSVVPHHLTGSVMPYRGMTAVECRRALGLPTDRLTIVSIGFINGAKLIHEVLGALAELETDLPPFHYVLAGEERPEEYDVRTDIRRLGLVDRVTITGYVSDDDFYRYLVAADLVVNLRYPIGGESSGSLIRALGLGRCCMVVNLGPFSEFPDDVVAKIDWTDDFGISFRQRLATLVNDSQLRGEFGRRAMKFVSRHHSIVRSAEHYHDIIDRLQPMVDEFSEKRLINEIGAKPFARLTIAQIYVRASALASRGAAAAPLREGAQAWWRRGLFPLPAGDRQVAIFSPIVEIRDAIMSIFGWSAQNLLQIDQRTPGTGENAYLFIHVPIECIPDSATAWISFGQHLERGGFLILSVWHEAVDADHEAISHLKTDLAKAGFVLVDHYQDSGGLVWPEDFSDAIQQGAACDRHGECLLRARWLGDFSLSDISETEMVAWTPGLRAGGEVHACM